jgi:hypothetical protein
MTSGSTDFTLDTNQIIDKAFHRLGKASEGEAMSARMYEDGRSSLNLILKSKLSISDRLFLRTERSPDPHCQHRRLRSYAQALARYLRSPPRQQQPRRADE